MGRRTLDQVDRELRKLSEQLTTAEQRLDYELVAEYTRAIDQRLDERHAMKTEPV